MANNQIQGVPILLVLPSSYSYGWPQLLLLFSLDNWDSQLKEQPVPLSAQAFVFSSKVILSPLDLESEIIKQMPGIQYAHPTILYVVRKVLMLIIILYLYKKWW